MENEKCYRCSSREIVKNEFSPEEKPYVIRTDHRCKSCNAYWYEDD